MSDNKGLKNMKKGIVAALLILVALFTLPYCMLYLYHADEVVRLEPYNSPVISFFGIQLQLPFNHVYGHGSGVLIGSRGYILTAGHMVNDSRLLFVRMRDGKTYKAVFVARYSKADLALLKIVGTKRLFYGVRWIGWKPQVGDEVFHIGNPMSFQWIFTDGRVSEIKDPYTVTTTVVNPGSSGGALYNRHGFLIGICSALVTLSPYPAFAGHSLFVNERSIKDFLAGWEGVL